MLYRLNFNRDLKKRYFNHLNYPQLTAQGLIAVTRYKLVEHCALPLYCMCSTAYKRNVVPTTEMRWMCSMQCVTLFNMYYSTSAIMPVSTADTPKLSSQSTHYAAKLRLCPAQHSLIRRASHCSLRWPSPTTRQSTHQQRSVLLLQACSLLRFRAV
jgi:hypothetical protein